MKFIKEGSKASYRKNKTKTLKENAEKVEDFILEQIAEYLVHFDVFLVCLDEYVDDRLNIVHSGTVDTGKLNRSEEIGKYLLHSLKTLDDIQFDACEALDCINENKDVLDNIKISKM